MCLAAEVWTATDGDSSDVIGLVAGLPSSKQCKDIRSKYHLTKMTYLHHTAACLPPQFSAKLERHRLKCAQSHDPRAQ